MPVCALVWRGEEYLSREEEGCDDGQKMGSCAGGRCPGHAAGADRSELRAECWENGVLDPPVPPHTAGVCESPECNDVHKT